MNKKEIRQKLINYRKNIDEKSRILWSGDILMKLEQLSEFKEAHHILFYYSVNGEVDTIKAIKKYIDKKNIYLPVITSRNIFQAAPLYELNSLTEGLEKVPEPKLKNNINYNHNIEIIITPGVGFDRSGNRIGMGKGYYDRYFEKNKQAIKIGLCFEKQLLDSVPKESYDKPVDIIITEQGIYRSRG